MPNGAVSVSPSSTTTSSAGMPSSCAMICAQVVSCPCPWDLAPVRRIALPRHVHLEIGRVEHLDAEDVVLAAVARAERLGHRGDAQAEQTPPLARFCLLLPEVLVVDRLEADVQALGVLPGVGQEAERGAVREVVVGDEVHPPERGLVHAEVVGGLLHHAFLEEHRLGDPERAPVRHPAGRLVGVNAAGGQVRDRDVVGGERGVDQADLELARLRVGEERAVVGVGVHPEAEDLAVACAAPSRP